MDKNLLKKITAAAAKPLPFGEIASAVGLTPAEWTNLLKNDLDAVAAAIRLGRAQAEVRVAKALQRASQAGSTEASLFILRRNFDWPRPKVGRPRKLNVPICELMQEILSERLCTNFERP